MLSKKSKYGLKALLTLAKEAREGPVLVAELAAREALPRKREITFGEVIRALDGPLAAVCPA